jgi:hypothetical protein
MKPENELELILPWLHNASLGGDEEKLAREFEKNQGQTGAAEKQLDDTLQSVLKQKEIKSPGQFGWFRLQRDIANLQQEKPEEKKLSRWLRPAMAAALFIIIIQGGFIMSTLQQPVTYAPLGQQQNYPVVLQVEFQPDATEERIRKLLGLVDGRLIDGPGAVGLYRVSLDLPANDEEAIDNRIKVLKTYSGVVRHVSRD